MSHKGNGSETPFSPKVEPTGDANRMEDLLNECRHQFVAGSKAPDENADDTPAEEKTGPGETDIPQDAVQGDASVLPM